MKIPQSKIALTVQGMQCYFPEKEENLNNPVKNSAGYIAVFPGKGKN